MSEIKNWKVMSDISDEDEQCEFIRTGIKKLDQSIQGLILGATSIWTGTNGSNKSGTIAQIALNVIDSKQCKVGIFSGELPDKRFKRWLYMQASGKVKEFVMPNTDKTAVEIEWLLDVPVREDLYEYIVNE